MSPITRPGHSKVEDSLGMGSDRVMKMPQNFLPFVILGLLFCRLFLMGRTETVHPASHYMLAWVKAMDDPMFSTETRARIMRDAIKHQTKFRLEATIGDSCDRHLLALLCASREMGMDLPKIFMDKVSGAVPLWEFICIMRELCLLAGMGHAVCVVHLPVPHYDIRAASTRGLDVDSRRGWIWTKLWPWLRPLLQYPWRRHPSVPSTSHPWILNFNRTNWGACLQNDSNLIVFLQIHKLFSTF